MIIEYYTNPYFYNNTTSNNKKEYNIINPIVAIATASTATAIKGGSQIQQNEPLQLLTNNPILIFDGNNLVHQITNEKQYNFNKNLELVLKRLSKLSNQYNIHLVMKTKDNIDTNEIQSTIKSIKKISKEYPMVTFHLAKNIGKIRNIKEKENKKNENINEKGKQKENNENENMNNENSKQNKTHHHLKGRDDFLAIYLGTKLAVTLPHKIETYIISKDKFKDYKHFKSIKPFNHLEISNGRLSKLQLIDPSIYFEFIDKPTIGNQITYDFADEQNPNYGKIIVEKQGNRSIILI